MGEKGKQFVSFQKKIMSVPFVFPSARERIWQHSMIVI